MTCDSVCTFKGSISKSRNVNFLIHNVRQTCLRVAGSLVCETNLIMSYKQTLKQPKIYIDFDKFSL